MMAFSRTFAIEVLSEDGFSMEGRVFVRIVVFVLSKWFLF